MNCLCSANQAVGAHPSPDLGVEGPRISFSGLSMPGIRSDMGNKLVKVTGNNESDALFSKLNYWKS